MDAPAIGAIVGVTFGGAWGIAGATALPHPWQAWSIGSSIGISAVLIVALALPYEQRQSGTFRGDTYTMAVAFEAVAIFATIEFFFGRRWRCALCAASRHSCLAQVKTATSMRDGQWLGLVMHWCSGELASAFWFERFA